MNRLVEIAGALVFSVALLNFARPASAEIYTVTYTGEVTDGQNPGGLFGGGDLYGDTFVATFWYDPAVGDRQTMPGEFDELTGPGAVNGTITINGLTAYLSGAEASEAFTEPGDIFDDTTSANSESVIVLFAEAATASLEATFPSSGGDDGGSQFFISGPDGEVCGYDLIAETVSVSVPEPTGWVLICVGFGGLGAAMRLRRRMASAQADFGLV